MEDSGISDITDSSSESKWPFMAVCVVTAVLAVASIIISFHSKGAIEEIQNQLTIIRSPEHGAKAGEIEDRLTALNSAITVRNNEITALKNKIDQNNANLTTLATKTEKRLTELAAAVNAVRTPVGTPLTPTRHPPGGDTIPGGGTPLHPPTPPTIGATGGTYVVRQGDNLTRIARQYGVTVSAIEVANPGVDSTKLKVGQRIKVPPRESVGTPRPSPVPPRTTPPPRTPPTAVRRTVP
ncbi:MAG: LysM peptidoglycan-binding domain-containing protein [Puniceicoccales bacterium]|nr:LysM peptidoglycan-binding domain-containing protein [Puniceicoccales bacterium]